MTGIQKAREALGHEYVSALMTTSELALECPKEIVDEYINDGFTDIFLRALNPYGLASDNDDWDKYNERFVTFYKQALDYIIEKNKQGIFFREDYATIILRKILTPYNTGFVDLQSPAGTVNSVLIYNYDGYVYASDESRMLADVGDFTFRLGKISDMYEDIVYGEKVRKMGKLWANEALAGCSDCPIKAYCGADPVRNHSTQGDMYGYRPSSFVCKKNKAIIKHLITMMIEREEEVMPIFRSWLR
jgi:radical SAM protein with 4Fe4S-binding SPASM domain